MLIIAAITAVFVMLFIIRFFYQQKTNKTMFPLSIKTIPYPHKRLWLSIITFLLTCGAWITLQTMPQFWHTILMDKIAYRIILDITSGLFFITLYGLIATLISAVLASICAYSRDNRYTSLFIFVGRTLKVIAFLVILNEALTFFGVLEKWSPQIHQFNQIAIISALSWCVFQCIQIGEKIFIQHNRARFKDKMSSRRAYTHIVIIKRLLMLLLSVVTIAAILMTFDRIRAAGTAILASAGVLATIVGFSARGLLENIFKGLQLAIAQPIRLEDIVTINGETGTVTAITLHHVVVSLSDRSQVIVPTSEFLDKTFKNWTHSSEDLLGNVLFYVKYNMPIEAIRQKFHEILKENECWDKGVGELEVNDFKGGLIELKLVISAKSRSQLGRLRNEIREQLLQYMQVNHPQELPG